ncbi:MAG: FxsA family protein [SAR324 cluster bacterium]|nr:FxsA family protein [SAR324 cluster bacterium]MCZ6533445.1 FxsA family protein [SAR324 cluster bacterium]MCZ6557117.1 FxsA family protein [SAR324 cluster bacterium]
MLKWVFLLISLVFVLEVWLLLTWGPALGTFWTIVWIVGSFFLGVILLRVEGVIKLIEIHRQLLVEEIPTKELLDLFLILLGSVMLVLPGFATDIFGLAMLLPPPRWMVRNLILRFIQRIIPSVPVGGGVHAPGPTIEIAPDEERD